MVDTSAIVEYRQSIIDELKAAGLNVKTIGDMKADAPYVLLHPSENDHIRFPDEPTMANDEIVVTYELSILAGESTEDTAYDLLDQYLITCLQVVHELDDVQVTDTGLARTSSNTDWLVSTIRFSNTITINL